ncbi:MAG: polyphosphate kinase 2 [Calditrichaeota bacterium]|nr:polyphosphate kinase 2 [Calditrichota bacterium]
MEPDNGSLQTDEIEKSNSKMVEIDGETIEYDQLIREYKSLKDNAITNKKLYRKAVSKYLQEKELKPYQAELIKMQQTLEKTGQKMIILFEGRDAAGKGGTIRRVTRYMNEKHYRVVALGRPTEEQKTQWFFQRYVAEFPHGGEIVLFDRSWYNRAMVEPVFGFCTDEEYENFMHGVIGFEKDLVRQGTILIKLYFSVTKDEQKRRFERRKNDKLRQWKLSEVDLQAQDRWDDFTEMKYRMLKRTSTVECPWTIIRSDNKHKARLNAMKVILNVVNYERLDNKLNFVPDAKVVISGAREFGELSDPRIGTHGIAAVAQRQIHRLIFEISQHLQDRFTTKSFF